jgi:hypothetical protein
MAEWYVRVGDTEHGPISSETLKQLALQGKVTPDSLVKKGTSGSWVLASAVKGLFATTATNATPPPILPTSRPSQAVPQQAPDPKANPPLAATMDDTHPCPYCGETILRVAKKCKHCGEFLERKPEAGGMTIIHCPDCGKDVSSRAPACPNCGRPINMKSGPFGGLEKGVTVRPDFWHDPNVGCVGAFIVGLVLFLSLIRGCLH